MVAIYCADLFGVVLGVNFAEGADVHGRHSFLGSTRRAFCLDSKLTRLPLSSLLSLDTMNRTTRNMNIMVIVTKSNDHITLDNRQSLLVEVC